MPGPTNENSYPLPSLAITIKNFDPTPPPPTKQSCATWTLVFVGISLIALGVFFGLSIFVGWVAFKLKFDCEWMWICVVHGVWMLIVIIIGVITGVALFMGPNDDND